MSYPSGFLDESGWQQELQQVLAGYLVLECIIIYLPSVKIRPLHKWGTQSQKSSGSSVHQRVVPGESTDKGRDIHGLKVLQQSGLGYAWTHSILFHSEVQMSSLFWFHQQLPLVMTSCRLGGFRAVCGSFWLRLIFHISSEVYIHEIQMRKLQRAKFHLTNVKGSSWILHLCFRLWVILLTKGS